MEAELTRRMRYFVRARLRDAANFCGWWERVFRDVKDAWIP